MNLSQFGHWILRHRLCWFWLGALGLCIQWNDTTLRKANHTHDQGYPYGWDNNGYFAWGRSLALDGDIDFNNDFEFVAHLRGFGGTQRDYARYMAGHPRTPTGLTPNKYGIGLGLLALPLLLTARLAAALHTARTGLAVSPFATIYPLAFIVSSILVGFMGIAVSFRLLARFYGRRYALGGVLAGLLGLTIGFYVWLDPTMAHGAGFGLTTLFVAVALRWKAALERVLESGRVREILLPSALMGLLLGVACMVRYTNATFGLVPAVLALAVLARSRKHAEFPWPARRWLTLALASLGVATLAALVGFLPQMVAWKVLYGSPFTYSYQGEKLEFWPRHAWSILVGPRNSLFLWTPLAILAVGGLLLAAVRGKELALAGLTVWLATLWIYGGWECYWLGAGFGMRGFTECSFFFFLGLAELFQRTGRAWPERLPCGRLLRGFALLLVLWNLYFILCFQSRIQIPAQPFAGRQLLENWPQCAAYAGNNARLMAGVGVHKYRLFTPAASAQVKKRHRSQEASAGK